MKRILSLICSFCLILSLCGCAAIEEVYNDIYGKLTVESRPHIAFSNGKLFKDSEEVIFEADEVVKFETLASKYRQDLLYNTLTDNEKTVYLALEYAMCEGWSNILIDDLLVDNAEDLGKILQFLAYDSPLLEQNLRYQTGTFNTNYKAELIGWAELDGVYITVENFTEELWDKKKAAIDKAKEIIASLPSDLSVVDKADRLYRTVAAAEYYDYGDSMDIFPFLYDALITGKTHCDGYSNALSLLYNMAGIRCVEKDFMPEDTNELGHTWAFFEVDGKWYNADATGGNSMIPRVASLMKAGYYFGYADKIQEYTPEYSELYPVAEEGLVMKIDAEVNSVGDNEFYTQAKNGFNKNREWTMVLVNLSTDKDCDRQIGRLADTLRKDLVYFVIGTAKAQKVVLVCYDKFY